MLWRRHSVGHLGRDNTKFVDQADPGLPGAVDQASHARGQRGGDVLIDVLRL